MKRIISFVLSVIMLISSTVFVVDAEAETNTCIRIEDTAGVDGYAAALDEINERVQTEGGVTVVMDVLVEENFTPDEGMFSQIVAFTGGGSGVKYNLLSYDFGANMFKAGQSAEWISGAQPDYVAIATNSFEWECGRWYELAFRFNGKKAAVYLNGICVISTEFDATLTDYFIIYPQFCAVRFDNIRICAKDYNVAEDTGTVWATEDFTGLADIDSSGVMYFDFSYTLSDVGSDSGVQPGDANGDGSVNSTDMVILRRMISGASVSVASGADVNLDGTVNTADITLLSRIIAGYIYDVDDSINVTPIFPDNSAIVEDDPEAPSEAVDNVIALIDDIGTVTYYSLSAITAAETAYAALTDEQKNEVTNYATLTAARSTYDALHAEVVAYKDAVAALPATATNTEECRNAIANCATAYATLTANGQISAVVAEKAKYDAFRAEWEQIVNEEAATIYNVIALIDDIGTVTYNSLSAITAAETAYAALTDEQKNEVTNYAILTAARSTYDALHAEVVAYKNAVAALPATATNTDACRTAIANCATAYATLTSPGQTDAVATEKAKYDAFRAEWENVISDEEAADSVIALIDDIGAVTYNSLSAITAAETAYAALTDEQKNEVTNYATLTAARSTYDALHAEVVAYKNAVAALPATATNTDACRTAIANCATAYATLTSPGQTDAVATEKAKYDTFRAAWEKVVADDEAANAVITKISSIGTVTYNSLSAITAAETAYANLTADQKNKVTNYSTLTAARSTYDALHAEVVAYKNAVAALPATATATDACETAIANCATAYATLTSPGQTDAVATEKAKYDTFRAAWEKAVADAENAVVDMGSGSGDTSGIDGSALKFTASESVSYSLLFSDQPQSYTDMALTFDVKIESIDSGADFAGLGVWSGNGTDGRSSFTGYDFADKRFTTDNNTFFPDAPTADSNVTMNLAVGEWNHFCFRRLNNTTMQVYVNGKLCYETSYDYANTYFIFAFKNCTAYVDNYQYYHAGTACGLITDFTTGATTDDNGDTRFADGGYWVVSSLNFAGVVKGQPGFDGSALKFDGNAASSYTLVLNAGPISNTDIALTFDVFVESIDSSQTFAGLGVWNGDGSFIGYDFKDQKFTAAEIGYPYPPDTDNGGGLALNVGEWNHFVFRRLNNSSYVVYVNGVKYAELTGRSYANTYMIFGFKNCVGYIDNYQAYENGVGKGLYTDFSKFTSSDGYLISPDGGYWMVGSQGFDSIYTTKTGGGVTGSGIAGTSAVPGSSAIDGKGLITISSGSTGGDSGDSGNTGGDSGGSSGGTTNNADNIGVSVDYSTQCTTGWELANRSAHIAKNYKTLYVMGCFGAPMTAANKTRYTQNHSYNKQASRTAMINAASSDTFGFDCVCLIKGILWGWSGNVNKQYGGAAYTSNGVPDFGSDAITAYVNNQRSTDWSVIEIGEAVWMSGHIGIYIGNGLAVECTPKWDNDVQITAVGGIGTVAGYNTRNWTAHGKLRYVSYTGSNDNPHTNGSSSSGGTTASYVTYTVQSGDTLSAIGAKYGVSYLTIANYNGISSPYTIHVGQVLKIPV